MPHSQGGQWRRALVAYDEMAGGNCRPDSGVYNAVVGTLWSTGILAAQAKAVAVFKTAVHAGHFRLSVHTSPDASAPHNTTWRDRVNEASARFFP